MPAAQLTRHSRPPWARWRLLLLALLRRTGLGLLGIMLVGWAVAGEASNPAGDPLGTLFYSAAERNALVRARQGPTDTAGAPVSSLMTINGLVKRQSGNSTAWVNGQAVQDGQSVPPASRLTTTERGVTLDGKPVRVGETLDLTTLQRSDIVAPGAVTTRPSK